jgi:NADH-quinone oxidoreductase subunit L
MLNINTLLVIALAPLLGAIVAGLLGRQVGRVGAHSVTIGSVAVSCVLSIKVLYLLWTGAVDPFNHNAYTFFQVGNFSAHIGFLVDRLTAMMMVVVSFVSLLVHVYTIGYMKDDPGYQRFFAYISLFTFSMLMLVMSNNFLQLFFGWEAVGLVSYLLIGFWYTRPSAIFANLKAFLVNRVGDFGFLLGIAGVLFWFQSLDYAAVFQAASGQAGVTTQIVPAITMLGFGGWQVEVMSFICISLFIGAMGKSAQVPLHVWLPDSMEGPTPISALIHAATMVTAGIFMVARMSPLFELSETALNFVLFIGATTAFFTGLIGMVQNDIKRVVAYSTLSQLGYMTVALGVSAYSAAVYHLMTHAFFKALLFLGAGSVIIAMHHEQDMRRMGGLRKYMPITFITMWIGTLALTGMPLLSGFYSKDTIIEAAAEHMHETHSWVATYGYWAVLLGVFVTSFYSFRLLYMTFHGRERFRDPVPAGENNVGHEEAEEFEAHAHDEQVHAHAEAHDAHSHDEHAHDEHGHDDHGHHGPLEPHESPLVVTIPLILLAIPSLLVGFLTVGPMLFGSFFDGSIYISGAHPAMAKLAEEFQGPAAMALSGFLAWPFWLAFAGFAMATWFYLLDPSMPVRLRRYTGWAIHVLEKKYWADDLWINGFARGGVDFGRLASKIGDRGIIDGIFVDGTAWMLDRVAAIGRRAQSGYLYHYAFAMILGLIVLLAMLPKLGH